MRSFLHIQPFISNRRRCHIHSHVSIKSRQQAAAASGSNQSCRTLVGPIGAVRRGTHGPSRRQRRKAVVPPRPESARCTRLSIIKLSIPAPRRRGDIFLPVARLEEGLVGPLWWWWHGENGSRGGSGMGCYNTDVSLQWNTGRSMLEIFLNNHYIGWTIGRPRVSNLLCDITLIKSVQTGKNIRTCKCFLITIVILSDPVVASPNVDTDVANSRSDASRRRRRFCR